MGAEATPDFSGYATKAGLRCSDGRTITPDAFKHQDGVRVPLVWQHNHNAPENVLGHAILQARDGHVYAYGFFNETPQGQNAKTLVEHRDITALSIYANQLVEKSKQVLHGLIREVSLVLGGANPGALIDNIAVSHSDTGEVEVLEDEAIIFTGEPLLHGDGSPYDEEPEEEVAKHENEPTVQDVYDSMTEEQKEATDFLVGVASERANRAKHSDTEDEKSEDEKTEVTHDDTKEGPRMHRNVFEKEAEETQEKHVLTHDAMREIVADAQKSGSLKAAVEGYALKHGINDIETLFPDARTVTDTPEFNMRRVEWVAGVLSGTKHSPFSRVRTWSSDLTHEDARAKGYIKGNLKKEEFIGVSRRSTTPTTVYKKQKLDRDDIVDITDFDVVTWLKAEMRLMLDEEIARAILIGDGREVDDEDKIRDPMGAAEGAGIRSILNDHDLYAATVWVDDTADAPTVVDNIISQMGYYKGSGSPTFYTTLPVLTSMMLHRDDFQHRLYRTPAELAAELGVDRIVTVEVMEDETDLIGIIVNLRDYTVGTDRGGEINFFDDFDIDYNQYKYLYETRLSGALTKIRSAIVVKRGATGSSLATPVSPTFNEETNVVTVPTTTGVTYKNKDTGATLSAGAQAALDPGETLTVEAVPASSSYYFATNVEDEYEFTGA